MGKKGFTLVELMVVIVIIGILAAVAIPRVMAAVDRARLTEGPQTLRSIATMQHVFYVEQGEFATDWVPLGMDKPKTNTWDFELGATADAFTAVATLERTVRGRDATGVAVEAKSGAATLTIDNGDTRDAGGGLEKLLRDWKNP